MLIKGFWGGREIKVDVGLRGGWEVLDFKVIEDVNIGFCGGRDI